MRFEFLGDRQDALPIIGRWYNQEWGQRIHGETEPESVKRLTEYLNIDKIPFILVATEQGMILGAAQLKYREMADLYPDKEHWLGGVLVAPEHRGRGFGSKLVQKIASTAPSYGVNTLHIQTEQLNGGLYAGLGWQPVEKVRHHGMHVLVMERHLGA